MASVQGIRAAHRRIAGLFSADVAPLDSALSTWMDVLRDVDDAEVIRRIDARIGQRRAPCLAEIAAKPSAVPLDTPKKHPGTAAGRIKQVEESIALFDDLITESKDTGNMAAAIAAAARRTAAEGQLHALRQAAAADKTRDPILRLERMRSAAAAEGSFVAVSKLGDQIEAARAQRKAARSRKRAPVESPVEFLEHRVKDLLEAADGCTGAARVAALRAVVDVRARLDLARKAAGPDELDGEELMARLAEEAEDMPDEHLAIFVRAYCDRHALDVPHRVHGVA